MNLCICDDADERLASLRNSPYLDDAWIQRVQAERFLNKPEIERERNKAKEAQ